jgi:hypothetical protein
MNTRSGQPLSSSKIALEAALLLAVFSSTASAQQSVLNANEWLMPGQYMSSPNGRYQLQMQTDGNLVLYNVANMAALWQSHTSMYPGLRAVMQADGNFVLYDGWVEYGQYNAYWHSHTWQYPGSTLHLQDDGNLVIYAPDGYVPWHTNTPQPVQPTGCYPVYSGCAECFWSGSLVGQGYDWVWKPGSCDSNGCEPGEWVYEWTEIHESSSGYDVTCHGAAETAYPSEYLYVSQGLLGGFVWCDAIEPLPQTGERCYP